MTSRREEVERGLAYLASLAKFGIVPTLDRIKALLTALGDPQHGYRVVHVAGTNGKGSTARMIAAALQEAGYVTGMFSSPHLVRYNERIMVQGAAVSDADLLALIARLRPVAEQIAQNVGHPTEFELSTAMALLHFALSGVEVAVVEVGMGGTWDSTNAVNPLLCVITPIAMDHTERLGQTLGEIAAQKAGIVKPGCPVVVAPQDAVARAVITNVADRQGARVVWVAETEAGAGALAHYTPREWSTTGGRFDLEGPRSTWDDLRVGLLGRHQITNAAAAATACQELGRLGLRIDERHVRQALAAAVWPGRMELLQRSPWVLLDGAHNSNGARALAHGLRELFPSARKILVLGMLAEKEVQGVLSPLVPLADVVVCTAPAVSRTPPLSPDALAQSVRSVASSLGRRDLRVLSSRNARSAVEGALREASVADVVCVCGSLYLVGEVRGQWFGDGSN